MYLSEAAGFINTPYSVGPQKLVRVINSAQDSMLTRKATDFATPTPRRPRMIRSHSHKVSKEEPEASSYFKLPADTKYQVEKPSTPSTSGRTSDTEKPDVTQEDEKKEEVQNSESPTPKSRKASQDTHEKPPEQVVLLVEDNDINMRVSLRPAQPAVQQPTRQSALQEEKPYVPKKPNPN